MYWVKDNNNTCLHVLGGLGEITADDNNILGDKIANVGLWPFLFISRRSEGTRWEILNPPPPVCPSICLSVTFMLCLHRRVIGLRPLRASASGKFWLVAIVLPPRTCDPWFAFTWKTNRDGKTDWTDWTTKWVSMESWIVQRHICVWKCD